MRRYNKILRTALLMVALAWTYVVIVPISSEGAHLMFPPERCVRLLRIVFYGRGVARHCPPRHRRAGAAYGHEH